MKNSLPPRLSDEAITEIVDDSMENFWTRDVDNYAGPIFVVLRDSAKGECRMPEPLDREIYNHIDMLA